MNSLVAGTSNSTQDVTPAGLRAPRNPGGGRFVTTRTGWMIVSALLLTAIAVLDYATTLEVQFSLFYFIPIALLAWNCGWELGFAAAVVAAVAWWIVEVLTSQTHSTPLIAGGNYAVRLAVFIIIAVTLSRLRRARDRERELNAALEETVAKLETSMAEINQLRNQMQLVCAWTNRIQSEGRWVPMDQFLADKLHLRISHGISEEAAARFFTEAPPRDPAEAPPEQPEQNDKTR